ncbi:unnamed protein product [Urochloa humidicola]
MSSKWSSCVRGPVFSVLLFLLVASVRAQQASNRSTDPVEANALKAVFDELGLKLWPAWFSGDPCVGAATDDTNIDIVQDVNLRITYDCSDHSNTVCHIVQLKLFKQNVTGAIPEELRNLARLTNLNLQQNYLTGPIPSFLGELTALQYMTLSGNALSGSIPKELGKLVNLKILRVGYTTRNVMASGLARG